MFFFFFFLNACFVCLFVLEVFIVVFIGFDLVSFLYAYKKGSVL